MILVDLENGRAPSRGTWDHTLILPNIADLPVADAAIAYAAAGWPVIPCWEWGPQAKAPRIAGGFKRASTDPIRVARWWETWPDALIGYALPVGMIVLDVDRLDALADLEAINGGPLPETLSVRTGRPGGGLHLYCRTGRPDLTQTGVRLADGKPVVGVDVRAGGRGYLILPPSLHPASGLPYRWETLTPAADLPAALEAACGPVAPRPPACRAGGHPAAGGPVMGLLRTVSAAPVGTRNRTLFWAACRMWERSASGLPVDWSGLMDAALTAGLDVGEVQQTINSAARRVQLRPVVAA